jgi:hypothetical protein
LLSPSLTYVSFYDAAAYLDPVPLFYEPFAIVALFYFFVTIITPTADLREQFYSDLERQHFGRSKGRPKHGGGSLAWFHVSCFAPFSWYSHGPSHEVEKQMHFLTDIASSLTGFLFFSSLLVAPAP